MKSRGQGFGAGMFPGSPGLVPNTGISLVARKGKKKSTNSVSCAEFPEGSRNDEC